jgi:hypothetical protein
MYVPEYTPQMKRKEGCFRKYTGLENKDFTPFIMHGNKGSRPLTIQINKLKMMYVKM